MGISVLSNDAVQVPAGSGDGRSSGSGVRCESLGALGHIVLDRPATLNALTAPMRRDMETAFARWARDPMIYAVLIESAGGKSFCAGGDLEEMARLGNEGLKATRDNAAHEYAAIWRLERFTKPHVALIDGYVLGSGVGLSQFGTHRVAGPSYAFSMPEVRIGFFPDCATSVVFGKLPDGIGLYLGLTGRRVGPGDAWRLGMATHCIAREEFPAIRSALADAQPVDVLLDGLHVDPGPGEITARRPLIRACFSAGTLPEIMARLAALKGADRDWAQGVLADLAKASPTSLAVALRLIRMGATMDIREALQVDLRLCVRMQRSPDFLAAAAAMLAGRRESPAWSPARIEDVDPAAIESTFAPLGEDELRLPEPDPPPKALG